MVKYPLLVLIVYVLLELVHTLSSCTEITGPAIRVFVDTGSLVFLFPALSSTITLNQYVVSGFVLIDFVDVVDVDVFSPALVKPDVLLDVLFWNMYFATPVSLSPPYAFTFTVVAPVDVTSILAVTGAISSILFVTAIPILLIDPVA